MKKVLSTVALTAVLSVALLSANDTTWTNPLSDRTAEVPHSMLNAVSNGTMYDGIDVLITSPAELSEFPGYSFYTAYGNYQSWSSGGATGLFSGPGGDGIWGTVDDVETPLINPFTTNGITGFFDGNGSIAFQLGYMMPIVVKRDAFQSGIVGGFEFGQTGSLNGTNDGNLTSDASIVLDGDADNIPDSSTTEAYDYTNVTAGNKFRIGAGTDLGFMGFSVLFNHKDVSVRQGGVYDYNWSVGEVIPVASTTTAKTVRYGMNEDGKTRLMTQDDEWSIQATGQLPLELELGKLELNMPVTASLRYGMSHDGGFSNNVPMTVGVTTGYDNLTGSGGVDDVSTLNYTIGLATFNEANANTQELGGGGIDTATLANAASLIGSPLAVSKDQKDRDMLIGISAGVDPSFQLSEIFKVKSRVKADFDFNSLMDNSNGYMSVSFSQAEAASANNSTWEYSRSVENPNQRSQILLDLEIGAILEAKSPNGRLSISSGLFYAPSFDLTTSANKPTVITETYSATDATGGTEVVAGDAFGVVAPGGTVGTQTRVTTTTFDGPTHSNTIDHNFIIPVTAKVEIVKDKFSLIGGYVLTSTIRSVYDDGAATGTTEIVDTYTTTAGTDVSPTAPAATAASTTTESSATAYTVPATWSGQMNFMVRWKPMDVMTVDFFGQSIVNALNFDIFGSGTGAGYDGFNVRNIIDKLGMSVTFSF